MIRRLFIANRGEVAIRIARAADDLGVAAIACYAEDDERSPHVLGSNDAVALPGADAPEEAFLALMRDVTHVVHCAALNNDRGPGEADLRAVNATLTGRLAQAAAARAEGRFIYLSSIRAVVGPGFSGRCARRRFWSISLLALLAWRRPRRLSFSP